MSKKREHIDVQVEQHLEYGKKTSRVSSLVYERLYRYKIGTDQWWTADISLCAPVLIQ